MFPQTVIPPVKALCPHSFEFVTPRRVQSIRMSDDGSQCDGVCVEYLSARG